MKHVFLCCSLMLNGLFFFAQRDLTPGGKKTSYFGKSDLKDYRFYGLQISAGPAFMFTRLNNVQMPMFANGRPASYTIDPSGRIGFFVEAGLAHFTKRRSKLAKAFRQTFISYYDYGMGVKWLSGREAMTLVVENPGGPSSISPVSGIFNNGYVYGRFSVHKNHYIGHRYFVDNGLGINMDYRLLETRKSYGLTSFGLVNDYNHAKFVAQLNYDLGFGIKLSRRSFLIPGIHLPVIGLNEWRGGGAALKWFDSNYLPFMAKVKLIYLFEKKVSGCNTPGSEDDRKRNNEFLQNN